MKNSACIIYRMPEGVLSGDVLLFKSLFDWTRDAALEAGIETVLEKENASAAPFGHILVLSECCPLIDSTLIRDSFEFHLKSEFPITVLCSTGEEEVCAAWIDASLIKDGDLNAENVGELLTCLCERNAKSGCFVAEEETQLFPVRDTRALYFANEAARLAVINRALENGAVIMCDNGIIISPDAVIGQGAQILPGTVIRGRSVIGEGAIIGPNSLIDNSEIGVGSEIKATYVTDSTVGDGTKIGPFTQLRPGSHIGNGVKIGDFVEIKNSTIGDKTAVAHLTYVGDSDVGRRVNFGCGTVTVNYDGKDKHRTQIGDYAFIGCNSNLVAPVKIGNNAYTAAGSTVTKDVPDDSLCVCRARDQRILEGWVLKRLGRRRYED